jgi:hypothetical protein
MILGLVLALSLAQKDTATIVAELTQIEQQLAETFKRGDCAAWGAMLAAGWSVIHLTGTIITKPEALGRCQAQAVRIDAFELADIAVRVYGDTAIVRGRPTVTTAGPAPVTLRYRFTDVCLHAAMGNRAEALRVFARCRELLRDEARNQSLAPDRSGLPADPAGRRPSS